MKRWMKWLAATVCGAVAAVSLPACGSLSNLVKGGFDASGYVRGILDSTYKGNFEEYMKLVDTTETEASENYEAGLEVEASVMASYLGFGDYYNSDLMDETLAKDMMEFYRQLYSKSDYEVKEAVKTDSGFNVEVTITPINLYNDAMDELLAYIDDFNAKSDNGDFDELDDGEYWKTYATGLVDICEGYLTKFTYGDSVSMVMLVYQDTDDLWTISDTDFQKADGLIVTYP